MDRLKRLLDEPHVHCVDEGSFLEKVSTVAKHGADKLRVFSDFDMTLTQYTVNGSHGYTSHAVIEYCSFLPENYKHKAKVLKDKYYPIEIALDCSKEEKVQSMVEWWQQAHELLIEHKIREDQLSLMVEEANIALRAGHELMFNMLEKQEVPLIIFSAGLADIIQCVLKKIDAMKSNMSILSNKMVFNEEGQLSGFQKPVVHTYNKGHAAKVMINQSTKGLQSRPNALLLGDSTGDPAMVEPLTGLQNVIKIGFLNYKEEELLSTYLDLYDVVLTGDTSLDFPCAVLATILLQNWL